MNRKTIHQRYLSVLLLLVAGLFGSAAIAQPTTAADAPAPGPLTRCDDAFYPSLTWRRCANQNARVSLENITRHGDLLLGVVASTLQFQHKRNAALRRDRERNPNPNTCTTIVLCPVDPRVQISRWKDHGGRVQSVFFTSRSGGTLSGHVWATVDGPDKRPGIVVIDGSILGYEQSYWYVAQSLAKAGFVVMTFDSQGLGSSDQFGEAPDTLEDAFGGTPVLGLFDSSAGTGGLGGNGLPFYDGGEDALNFFLATPEKTYEPVQSRSTGTSHAAKQKRRVTAGFDNAFNPFWKILDSSSIGIAGHSYGAVAASWLLQHDDRLTTAVAWDNLCVPTSPSRDELAAVLSAGVFGPGQPSLLPAAYGIPRDCFGAPAGPAPEITKPALGITSDYLFLPVPYSHPPDRQFKSAASLDYSDQGVDTGTIVIRGGTHLDYNDAPGLLPSSLRGPDLMTWYTVAWFKKYLQHDPVGDQMLLTARWRNDSRAQAVDPADDPNLFSWHYQSRLSIHREDGTPFDCEDLRTGCDGQLTRADDGGPPDYSFHYVITHPGSFADPAATP